MFAGRIVEKNRIELVDAPEMELPDSPASGSDAEILFQPELACLCGSDLPFFRGEKPEYPLEAGYSLHEMIGTVVDTNGERFRKGDRVLAVPIGQHGFFERYRLTERRAIPLDERCSPAEAVMAQPLGTVIYGLRKLSTLLDVNVAIVGQGPIGQLFCAALRNLGAREIIALDRLDDRLAVSPRMGATVTVNVDREDAVERVRQVTGGDGADLVVEAVGHVDQALNFSGELCREGGTLLSFGVPPRTIDGVEWSRLFFKNLKIQTTVDPDFDRDFPLAMRWIAERRIGVSPIITHTLPVTECQRAFELFRDREDGALKVFLDFA